MVTARGVRTFSETRRRANQNQTSACRAAAPSRTPPSTLHGEPCDGVGRRARGAAPRARRACVHERRSGPRAGGGRAPPARSPRGVLPGVPGGRVRGSQAADVSSARAGAPARSGGRGRAPRARRAARQPPPGARFRAREVRRLLPLHLLRRARARAPQSQRRRGDARVGVRARERAVHTARALLFVRAIARFTERRVGGHVVPGSGFRKRRARVRHPRRRRRGVRSEGRVARVSGRVRGPP